MLLLLCPNNSVLMHCRYNVSVYAISEGMAGFSSNVVNALTDDVGLGETFLKSIYYQGDFMFRLQFLPP